MKVIVLGADGMLGHMVYSYFLNETNHRTLGLTRKNLDATLSKTDIALELQNYEADVIINCIGLIHKHAEDVTNAFQVNSAFPHILAELGNLMKFKLIHISSDCVYDNTIYGKSKLAGEVNNKNHLTVRTSIIGPEIKKSGTGLMHWFMKEEKPVTGYNGVSWDGVTTLELAKKIDEFINDNVTGLVNYRTKYHITKYHLLVAIKDVFNKDIIINKDDEKLPDRTIHFVKYENQKHYYKQLLELKNYMLKFKNLYEDYL